MIALSLNERTAAGWIIDQLRLQPYQHILEIGVGTGRLMEEAAGLLRIGFLAGVESSAPHYQQAYRRNKRFIARQLVQLHLGELADLPYPPHYFHTVYSSSGIPPGKDRMVELLRLTRMLRSGGQLTLLFRPGSHATSRREDSAQLLTRQVQQDYAAAGLRRIQIEHRLSSFGSALAATGYTE
jgi:ubiquinone/menaquinone biosynthesis C-methylase UbiE